MAERAKLDSETQTVGRTPLHPHQGEIFCAEDKVAGHFGGLDRDGEQPDALLRRQQSTTWHDGLDWVAGGPFINTLPFSAIM
jgi:hypothetical protein